MFVASPRRGEMFIARRIILCPELRRSATVLLIMPIALPGFAPNGAKVLVFARTHKHLAPLERKQILRISRKLTRTPFHLPSQPPSTNNT
jgi:hypothetical protein